MIYHRDMIRKHKPYLSGKLWEAPTPVWSTSEDLGCLAQNSKAPTVTVGNQLIRMGKRAASKTGALTRATVKARGEWAVIALTRKCFRTKTALKCG